jgi:sec-independent protein translocase protein TatC
MEGVKEYIEKYGEYLEDARRRLYRMVIVFCVIFTIGFFSTTWFVKILVAFFKVKDATIVATSPFQLLDLAMSVGFFLAVVVILPLFVQQAYVFLRSGLLEKERRFFLILLPVAAALFIIGFSYGIMVMYFALGFIAAVNVQLGIANLWDISQFISMVMLTSVLLGILFEFPLILTLLIRMEVVTTRFLIAKRRHAYIIMLIFVILLPPTDGLSDIIMVAPLVIIYELTILLNSNHLKRAL